MALHSTKMPDGQMLEVNISRTGIDTQIVKYSLDGKEVTQKQATKAWDAQPFEWQRGRSLQKAIKDWTGGAA